MKKINTENVQSALQNLQRSVARLTEQGEQHTTAIPGLSLFRRDEPTPPVSGMYAPSICMVVQGAKRVILGEDEYIYDAHHYLITAIHLPTIVQVIHASKAEPYLGLRLMIEPREITQMMLDSNLPASRIQQSSRGMATSEVTAPLLNAFQRLLDLLDTPEDVPILSPIIQREILYRLLTGEQGVRLRQIATAGSQSQQIARVIEWLKSNFKHPLRIDDLAEKAHMSLSTFHHHFRSMTALSPLQFQKNLRLQEARRLMLMEYLDAAAAAYQVGYDSPSQFNREYSRLFGQPPLRDISNLRKAVND